MERTAAALRATMGLDTPMPSRPTLPEHGPTGRWLTLLACLSVVADVRALHATMEVPDEVSWASLGILGEGCRTAKDAGGSGSRGPGRASPSLRRLRPAGVPGPPQAAAARLCRALWPPAPRQRGSLALPQPGPPVSCW
ncbi:acyltransferase domain-containing protein [Streptomyces sp. NPDC048256]|uniref:acyltransferase domain-containing protein n=1 Tax=Streptomyces sp. NPDC048256 TaxID=3154613 RepID=UPI0033E286C8